jgi:uncharacterized protein (UPF0333 family)
MLSRRAQSLTEYMLFFTVVAFAISGITTYLQRGIKGTVRSFSSMVGQQEDSESKMIVKERVNNTTTVTNARITDNPSQSVNAGGVQGYGFNLTQKTDGTSTTHNETDK